MADNANTRAVVTDLLTQARQRLEEGHADAAQRLWGAVESLATAEALPDLRLQALHQLAAFDIRQQQLDAARRRLDEAFGLARALGADAPLAAVGARLGQVLVFVGEPHNGVVVMREAQAAWRRLDQEAPVRELDLAIQAVCSKVDEAVSAATSPAALVHALFGRARVRLAIEDAGGARSDLQQAWDLCGRLERADFTAVVGTLLGQLLTAAADPSADAVLARAQAAWSAQGDPEEAARVAALRGPPQG